MPLATSDESGVFALYVQGLDDQPRRLGVQLRPRRRSKRTFTRLIDTYEDDRVAGQATRIATAPRSVGAADTAPAAQRGRPTDARPTRHAASARTAVHKTVRLLRPDSLNDIGRSDAAACFPHAGAPEPGLLRTSDPGSTARSRPHDRRAVRTSHVCGIELVSSSRAGPGSRSMTTGFDFGGDGDGRRRLPPRRQHHRRGAAPLAGGVRRRLDEGRRLLLLLRPAALAGLPGDLRGGPEEVAAAHPAGRQRRGRPRVRRRRSGVERPARRLRVGGAVPAGGAAPGRRRRRGRRRTTSTRWATRRCGSASRRRSRRRPGRRSTGRVIHYNDRITRRGDPRGGVPLPARVALGGRVDHRPVLRQDRQGVGHRQRPQRLVPRGRRPALHPRPARPGGHGAAGDDADRRCTPHVEGT